MSPRSEDNKAKSGSKRGQGGRRGQEDRSPKGGQQGQGSQKDGGAPGGPQRPRLRAGHKILLALFGALLACILIVGLEIALRVTGYGPDLSVFKKTELLGTEYWEFNRDVSLRYFPPEMERKPGFERFPVLKEPGTYRVFSLGASSTMGDPFGAQASFSAFLEEMLKDAAPGQRFEVVNLGIVAISSMNVLDLVPEVLEHEPDALLIYTGHNETYGADAVLSGLRGTFSNRWMLKTRMKLRNTRVGMLALDLARKLRSSDTSSEKTFGMDLMEGKVLPTWDGLYQQMLDIYRGNLEEIIRLAHSKGVAVILCTLPSNLRDQSPFGSEHNPELSGVRMEEWKRSFEAGKEAMARKEWESAAEALRKAVEIDSFHAEAQFRLARCLDAMAGSTQQPRADPEVDAELDADLGAADSTPDTHLDSARDTRLDSARSAYLDQARDAYRTARDQDVVRFRAGTGQNRVVREVAAAAAGPDLILVDLERAVVEISPDHLPGWEFMTEHVHPHIHGHAFLAEQICRALASNTRLEALGSWDLTRLRSADEYKEEMGLGPGDEAAGLILTLNHKMKKWPFTHAYENRGAMERMERRIQDLVEQTGPIEAELLAAVAAGRYPEGFDYGTRHQAIAQQAMTRQQPELALREFRKCERYWGPMADNTVNMAQASLLAGHMAETDSLLDLASRLDPGLARTHFVRAMLRQNQGRMAEAQEGFQTYLRMEPGGLFANAARQMLARMRR